LLITEGNQVAIRAVWSFALFLGARQQYCEEATISFVISVSVRTSLRVGQVSSHWTDFHEIFYSGTS